MSLHQACILIFIFADLILAWVIGVYFLIYSCHPFSSGNRLLVAPGHRLAVWESVLLSDSWFWRSVSDWSKANCTYCLLLLVLQLAPRGAERCTVTDSRYAPLKKEKNWPVTKSLSPWSYSCPGMAAAGNRWVLPFVFQFLTSPPPFFKRLLFPPVANYLLMVSCELICTAVKITIGKHPWNWKHLKSGRDPWINMVAKNIKDLFIYHF